MSRSMKRVATALVAVGGLVVFSAMPSSATVAAYSFDYQNNFHSFEYELMQKQNMTKRSLNEKREKVALWPVYFCGPNCDGFLRGGD